MIELIDTPVDHNLYIDGATRHVKIGSVGCRLDPTVANNLRHGPHHGRRQRRVRQLQIPHNDVQALRVWRNRFGNQLRMQDNTVRPDRTFITGNTLDPALHDC